MYRKNIISISFNIFILFSFFFTVFILTDKNFMIWSQVKFLNIQDYTLSNCFFYGCSSQDLLFLHGPRRVLIKIINTFAMLSQAPFAVTYDYVLTFLVALSSFLLGLNQKKYIKLCFALFLAFLSYQMNGRMVFVIFSTSLLIYILSRKQEINLLKVIILLFIANFFASVSSGTMLCFFIYSIIFYIHFFRNSKASCLSKVISLIPLLPWAIYCFIAIRKNLFYFDFHLFNFLKHGYGIPGLIIISIILLISIRKATQSSNLFLYYSNNLPYVCIFVSMGMGVIGKTSITPALVLTSSVIFRAFFKKYDFPQLKSSTVIYF